MKNEPSTLAVGHHGEAMSDQQPCEAAAHVTKGDDADGWEGRVGCSSSFSHLRSNVIFVSIS